MLAIGPYLWQDGDDGSGSWVQPGVLGAVDLASAAQIAAARTGQPRGVGIFHFAPDADTRAFVDAGGVLLSSEDPRDARPDGKLLDTWQSLCGYRPGGDTLADMLWDQLTTGADPANLDAPGILVPGSGNRLQLWLGGLIREDRFVWGSHPHTAKLRDLLQRQLNDVRDAALSGKLVDPITRRTADDYYLRVADAICEKYAGKKAKAKAGLFADLKPAKWAADEQLKPHNTTILESFDTADSGTLGPDLVWTESSAVIFSVVSNSCDIYAAATQQWARADTDLSSTDQYAQAVTVEGGSGGAVRDFGVMTRKDGTTTKTYYTGRVLNSANVGLFKLVAGTQTQIGSSVAITFSTTAILKQSSSGSTITVDYDGVNKISQTDTAVTSGLRCGVDGWMSSSGVTVHPRVDSFEAGDIVAATTYAPPPPSATIPISLFSM